MEIHSSISQARIGIAGRPHVPRQERRVTHMYWVSIWERAHGPNTWRGCIPTRKRANNAQICVMSLLSKIDVKLDNEDY